MLTLKEFHSLVPCTINDIALLVVNAVSKNGFVILCCISSYALQIIVEYLAAISFYVLYT